MIEHSTTPTVTNTPTIEASGNDTCWPKCVYTALIGGGILVLGLLGYIIYSIIIVLRPDDEQGCSSVPPIHTDYGMLVCSPFSAKYSLCMEKFTEDWASCQYNATSHIPNGGIMKVQKVDRVPYDLFSKFASSYIPALGNLSCVSQKDAINFRLPCCSPAGLNSSSLICNGELPHSLLARPVAWPPGQYPYACAGGFGCGGITDNGLTFVDLESLVEANNCISRMGVGYSVSGGSVHYMFDC